MSYDYYLYQCEQALAGVAAELAAFDTEMARIAGTYEGEEVANLKGAQLDLLVRVNGGTAAMAREAGRSAYAESLLQDRARAAELDAAFDFAFVNQARAVADAAAFNLAFLNQEGVLK